MPCREHLAQLRERNSEIQAVGARVAVISFSPPEQNALFVGEEDVPFLVLSDTGRAAYRAFGLESGAGQHIWTVAALRAYLRGLLQGRWPRWPTQDITQLGGDFVVDSDNRIVYAHRSEDPADRPSVDALIQALRRAANGSE